MAIVAPSSPVNESMLKEGIAELERLGFTVTPPADPSRKWRYLAGEDRVRLAELRQVLLAPEVACVFCARGGYGLNRLVAHLDESWFAGDPKIIVGFSDATALLNIVALNYRIPCIYGPMPAQDLRHGPSAYDEELLLALLRRAVPYGPIAPDGLETLRGGKAEGILAGGCLSVLCSLVGTPFEPDVRGTILVIEDIGEKPYRIDRMLTQLRLAGWFDALEGIVFGEMPDCVQHPDQGYRLVDILLDRLDGTAFPVLFGFPTGHTRSVHRALPLGVKARLDADHRRIELLEALVKE